MAKLLETYVSAILNEASSPSQELPERSEGEEDLSRESCYHLTRRILWLFATYVLAATSQQRVVLIPAGLLEPLLQVSEKYRRWQVLNS